MYCNNANNNASNSSSPLEDEVIVLSLESSDEEPPPQVEKGQHPEVTKSDIMHLDNPVHMEHQHPDIRAMIRR